ncbi:membrane-spanning 4-domains subfamily A member 4A-like [Cavia porcellus]|uniref:Membrane spanning 4-domains A4A n=1 Tax=Cavia porcellus TaxID=10141 RepID=A0A286Y186_CAVPO|nr:membrane-spanning 4-domains subfamily A member 4A-like [Cavia porcellus]
MKTLQDVEPIAPVAEPPLVWRGKPEALALHLWERRRKTFLRGKPEALGVVQIVIGLINFSFGLVFCFLIPILQNPILFNMLYWLWGSVAFIISGTLSIAAGTSTTKRLVNSSLGLNITSCVLAAVGTIIIINFLTLLSFEHQRCTYTFDKICSSTLPTVLGMESVVLIVSVLEFCIAMCLSVSGCKTTCCDPSEALLLLSTNISMEETSPEPIKECLETQPYEEIEL